MALEGASVVIIGGSSGMGLATARMARKAGARVTIAARDRERLEAARQAIGDDARAFALDVADEDAVRRMFDEVGRLDHLVMLAGEQPVGSLVDTDTSEFHRAVNVRFWGSLYACKYAAPRISPAGSITLCSGVSAYRPQPKRAVGAATTAAVEAFGRSLARELAPIRVNTICPGAVDTPVLERFFGGRREEMLKALAERLPAGRIGEPDDVAHAIIFLMENRYVTGITLHVDGGYLLL